MSSLMMPQAQLDHQINSQNDPAPYVVHGFHDSSQPPLSWDILFIILEFQALDPETRGIPVLMKTCKTLYKAGVPIFLHLPCRIFSDRVESFCDFVLKEPPRAEYIGELSLLYAPVPEIDTDYIDVTGKLAQVLSGCKNIRNLHLLDGEPILGANENIARAIASCSNIQEIRIGGVGRKTAEMLRAMRSAVTSVDLDFDTIDGWDEDWDVDPLGPLSNFSAHLTTVALSHAAISESAERNLQFPRVKSLLVETVEDPDVGLIQVLAHSFPNVTSLNWQTELSDDETAFRIRQLTEQAIPDGTWKHLDQLVCGAWDAYTLNLQTRIRTWCNIHLGSLSLPLFRIVLETIQPANLELRIMTSKFALDQISAIFPTVPIRHLDVTLDLYDCTHNLEELLDNFSRNLQNLSLTFLVIDVMSPNNYLNANMRDNLREMDVGGYVRQVALRCPDLTFAAIAAINFSGQQRSSSYWRVHRADTGSVDLEKLSGEVGEDMKHTSPLFQPSGL